VAGVTCVQEVMVAGGMESMSNAPFYIVRGGLAYGGAKIMVSYMNLQTVAHTAFSVGYDCERFLKIGQYWQVNNFDVFFCLSLRT